MRTRPRTWIAGAVLSGLIGIGGYSAGFSAGQERQEQAPDEGKTTIYELRTYTTHPGRLPALHKRFEEHTMRLFEKHGMKNGLYWVPVDEALKDNTLIYFVSHDSREAAEKSWDGFLNDPEWIRVRDESEKDGKLLAKVVSVYLKLADYSPEDVMRSKPAGE